MNKVAEEMMAYLTDYATFLAHYGMPRRSGRYPWGSGDNPYQHSGDFLARVNELKSQGLSEKEIASEIGLTTTQLRTQISLAKSERDMVTIEAIKDLQAKGYSNTEIAEKLGLAGESTVRSMLNSNKEANADTLEATIDILRKSVDENGVVDVGAGVAQELGISEERLQQSLYALEMEGYNVYGARMQQVTNVQGKKTTLKLLCKEDVSEADLYLDDDDHSLDTSKISSVVDYTSHDGGVTYDPVFVYPKSMSSSRLSIRYAEDGGTEKDGLVEIRRGVDDLSLGSSRYSQVRILVDDTKYIKGMAVYSDDLPDGVDVVFNTNKSKSVSKLDVLKDADTSSDNPFGSLIKSGIYDPAVATSTRDGGQSYYYDKNGKKQLSLINKRADEGDWGTWSNKLSAQFLSKQSSKLIRQQLNLTIADQQIEYDEICSLTNPTVKRSLLLDFADSCDAAAVHLKAAALPRQKYQVIIPLTSLKDNEIYAPNYKNGETVALVRYPHGGTFEIPILKVNNKNSEGNSVITKLAEDAVGINSAVAARLSGADFDGDTVLVIPCNSSTSKVKITSTSALKGLVGFDPKLEYATTKGSDGSYYDSSGKKVRIMSKKQTQREMGSISNLITDMTIKGATDSEKARAVRHSMVVIDAAKHKLNYKQSEVDNDIDSLRKRYQTLDDGSYGKPSTLLSRAKSQISVPKTYGAMKINDDGSVSYKISTYTDKNGNTKTRMMKSTQMAATTDAYTLSSGRLVENLYANYANTCKAMANAARKEYLSTGKLKYSSDAAKKYASEVADLLTQLKAAKANAPRERKAQALANSIVKAKTQAYPDLDKSEIKKIRQQAITSARASVGAKRVSISVSAKQWEAIQAGAIHDSTLSEILQYTDSATIRQYATPKSSTSLSATKINKIKAMAASGSYTIADIADSLGISTSTVKKYM